MMANIKHSPDGYVFDGQRTTFSVIFKSGPGIQPDFWINSITGNHVAIIRISLEKLSESFFALPQRLLSLFAVGIN